MSEDTLFSLVSQANAIEQAIAEAGGELSPEIEAALANIDIAVASKVDGYNAVMDRLDALAAYWKAEADKRAKIAKSVSAASDRLNANIKAAMLKMGKDEVIGNDVRFKLAKTKGRLVINEQELDPSFKMEIRDVVPDKERIKTALEDGFSVSGATLEPSFSLRSYTIKGIKK